MSKKQLTKAYIIQSLFILMKTKDYTDITIQDITNKAGINRSTYYRNFSCKENIIETFFNKIMDDYLEEYKCMKNNSIKTYLYTLFKHFYNYRSELLLIDKNNLTYIFLNVLNNYFNKIYNLAETNLEMRYELYYHIGGIYSNYKLWFSRGMKETPEKLADIVYSTIKKELSPYLLESNK